MGIFNFGKKKKKSHDIQALGPDGAKGHIQIESLLTGQLLNVSVPGTTNAYQNYESQVLETYRKYNGRASFGVQQTRAIVDIRSGFISGEGVNVASENDATIDWIEKFLNHNNLNSHKIINLSKGAEMAGQALMHLRPGIDKEGNLIVDLLKIPYSSDTPYKIIYKDKIIRDKIFDIQIKDGVNWKSLGTENYVYVRTGGDDYDSHGPTTKVGVLLTDIENYDRAIRDQRRLNHVTARVTPVFKTDGGKESAKQLKANLTDLKWRIGETYIGNADFSYATPGQGAHQNLNSEMVATIKTIASVTGIPVHWLGYVDLMSNRATARELYENIKNQTSLERMLWEDAMYDAIVKAQIMYIDNGGRDLPKLDLDFQVRMPLINFDGFIDMVKALSTAYLDEAISIDDYRNFIPGIDPLKTKKAIEAVREEEIPQETIMEEIDEE